MRTLNLSSSEDIRYWQNEQRGGEKSSVRSINTNAMLSEVAILALETVQREAKRGAENV